MSTLILYTVGDSMINADLHIHSSYSDGELRPDEIINRAVEKKLQYISITDHDTISSQFNKSELINIIPGVELSSRYNEQDIHILGYGIDLSDNNLINALEKIRVNRIDRAREIIELLKIHNIDIDIESVINNRIVGRSNIAHAIVERGYADSYSEAFNKYLTPDSECYVPGDKLNVRDAIELILKNGGIPVLAHPGRIYNAMHVEDIIKILKSYGLKGVEVYHPSHNLLNSNKFYNICKKYKLIITGGSDFHRYDKNKADIGECGISTELMNKFLTKV